MSRIQKNTQPWKNGVITTYLAITALYALRQQWRTQRFVNETHSPAGYELPTQAPLVSIVLPVRNEEQHIDAVLETLVAQNYPDFEILVVDDGSTDTTPQRLAAWEKRVAHLRLLRIEALPSGWVGKAHALQCGVEAARGDWVLFTDADTRHAPDTLHTMMGYTLHRKLDLVSMITDMKFVGPGMHILMPVGALVLVERATPGEMREQEDGGAIAVGQFMLVRRSAYLASGGYSVPMLRKNFADDVGLAEHFKRSGLRVDLVNGKGLVFNKQWTTWRSAWQGWRKSCAGEIVAQPALGMWGGLSFCLYGLAPLVALGRICNFKLSARQRKLALFLGSTTLAGQVGAHAQLGHFFKRSRGWIWSAPLGWFAFGLLLFDTLRMVLGGKGYGWKDRAIPVLSRTPEKVLQGSSRSR